MSQFKAENIQRFHELLDYVKDDFDKFKELVDELDPEDRLEVAQLFQNMMDYVKGTNKS